MRRYLKHRYNSPFTCSIPVPPREAFVQYVEVKIHDAVATILMERPKTCNALHPQLLEELSLAFSDVHQEKKVQAVILSGSGSHFCSGLDFNTLRAISELETSEAMPQWFKIWERLSEVYETMLRFPKPIVAAVDGGAIGAGLGLTLASDIIVCSQTAFFSAPAIQYGLVAGSTAALLDFRFGSRVAADLLLTCRRLGAAEAFDMRLVHEPVSSSQIWVRANEIASQWQKLREKLNKRRNAFSTKVLEKICSHNLLARLKALQLAQPKSPAKVFGPFLRNAKPSGPPDIESWK